MLKQIIFNIDQLPKVAESLSKELHDCKIITFSGPLGAGKTTLIQNILRNFGVNEDVISPTFTYMNIYKNSMGKIFFHFDLYRIKTVDDFFVAGFDEYLTTENSMCLIEWPEVIEPLLKLKHQHVCRISIDYEDTNKRILKY